MCGGEYFTFWDARAVLIIDSNLLIEQNILNSVQEGNVCKELKFKSQLDSLMICQSFLKLVKNIFK